MRRKDDGQVCIAFYTIKGINGLTSIGLAIQADGRVRCLGLSRSIEISGLCRLHKARQNKVVCHTI